MDILPTHVHQDGELYRENHARMTQLVAQLQDRVAEVRQGGGEKYLQRHRQQGKLPARERIDRLLDAGSPFLEIASLAAWDMYDNDAPGAGIVTGVGRVSGREVLIVANDATVKGGTYYPDHGQEASAGTGRRAREPLPCIYLVDSGGAFLPLQAEVFPDRDTSGASSSTRRACRPKASRRLPS
jgi:3-methylcrotonyl-CoA carboxylase beta subunit/propionyl-CoA carboxylase